MMYGGNEADIRLEIGKIELNLRKARSRIDRLVKKFDKLGEPGLASESMRAYSALFDASALLDFDAMVERRNKATSGVTGRGRS